MIILSISVFLLACICMSLEHKIETLAKHFKSLKEEIEDMDSSFARHARFHAESIGKLTNINEGMQNCIDDLYERVEAVSHETTDIKRYYCNYVSKKGNE